MRLAIDLGGTHLRFGLGSGDGPWIESHATRRPPGLSPQGLAATIGEQLARWAREPATLAGIGVSAAGLVDPAGRIVRAENLGWTDVALGEILREAFGRPVQVETDVFCGAAYEAAAGAARGARAALYIGVGTGIGHAFILDRKVWRGAERRANAMGHMVLWPGGDPCYCGNAGCLCTVASGLAQSETPRREAGLDALAQAIGIATTLIDPDCVILAGGALNQPWFDLQGLAERLPRFTYPGLPVPRLLRSDTADANLRGAALLLEETP